MKTNSFLHNFFLVTMTVCGMALIGIIFEACQSHHNGGTCTYEGLECPNALAEHIKDSAAYADAEYVIDSLVNSNDSLKTALTGCENKDHSKIPTSELGTIHMNHDKDGGINLVYIKPNDPTEYHLDYVIDDWGAYPIHVKDHD